MTELLRRIRNALSGFGLVTDEERDRRVEEANAIPVFPRPRYRPGLHDVIFFVRRDSDD